MLNDVPMLARMVLREDRETIDLIHSVSIEVHAASFKSTRGYTVIAALLDEIAYWPTDDAAEPDQEIISAIRPAMATIPNSMLLCASSPYARKGALFEAYRRHHAQDHDPVLVWHADTRTMNPTVDQQIIDAALTEDHARASADYLAIFRQDVETFVSREVIEACTVPGRHELPPIPGIRYVAFVDPSGGSSDSMTLAIAHRDKDVVIVDAVRERRPPFSPDDVVTEFCDLLDIYHVRHLTGDRYGGEWCREPFRKQGITYEVSEQVKSDIYRDALPLLNSNRVELLDLPRLAAQLAGLERRTSRGGRDSIDHAPGQHDDIANAVLGAVVLASAKKSVLVIPDRVLRWSRRPGVMRAPAMNRM
jgi:hypothetical protein